MLLKDVKRILFKNLNITRLCNLKINSAKTAIWQAEKVPNLPTWQEMFWEESLQCNLPLFNKVAGKWK